MNLDKISVDPRIRSGWEALDLGFVMTRAWWKLLFLSWAIPAGTAYLLLSLIFFNIEWLPVVIVWWLKPLWDRGPLYIASRKLFGEDVTLREVLYHLPKLYLRDLLPALIIRRLSFSRSMDMPLTVLEQLKGNDRSRRLGLLHRFFYNAATWLTIVCVHIETIAIFGVLILILMFVPADSDFITWKSLIDGSTLPFWFSNTVSVLCMSLMGPFYAVAGFSLYINRRVDLEAWDIEIRFRHIVANQEKALPSALKAGAVR